MSAPKTNILDAIVAEHDLSVPAPPAPVAPINVTSNPGHHFDSGHTISMEALRPKLAAIRANGYRGLGADVSDCGNDPACIAARAGLAWKTVMVPLMAVGRKANKPFKAGVGLYRSDTADNGELGFATMGYHPHHNHQILKMVTDWCREGGLTVQRAGSYEGGNRVFVVAGGEATGEVAPGDIVALRVIARIGHTPGIANVLQAWAERLLCTNGATVRVAQGKVRMIHSKDLSVLDIARARAFVRSAVEAFDGTVAMMRDLYHVPTTPSISALYLTDVLAPDLYSEFVARLDRMSAAAAPADSTPRDAREERRIGAGVIERILRSEASRRVLGEMIGASRQHTLRAVLDVMDSQPGADATRGTLAHPYAAISHYQSNLRGRTPGTGLEQALFGDGAATTAQALDTAQKYAVAIREVRR